MAHGLVAEGRLRLWGLWLCMEGMGGAGAVRPQGRRLVPWAGDRPGASGGLVPPTGRSRVGDGIQAPRPRRGPTLPPVSTIQGYLGNRGPGYQGRVQTEGTPRVPRGHMSQTQIMSEGVLILQAWKRRPEYWETCSGSDKELPGLQGRDRVGKAVRCPGSEEPGSPQGGATTWPLSESGALGPPLEPGRGGLFVSWVRWEDTTVGSWARGHRCVTDPSCL